MKDEATIPKQGIELCTITNVAILASDGNGLKVLEKAGMNIYLKNHIKMPSFIENWWVSN